MTAAAQVAAAVDDVPALVQDGLHHRDVVARVVLEVRILDDRVVAGGELQAGPDRGPFPTVLRHPVQPHAAEPGDDLRGAIPRTVVDDDDLLGDAERAEIDRGDLLEQVPDETFLVISGNDY